MSDGLGGRLCKSDAEEERTAGGVTGLDSSRSAAAVGPSGDPAEIAGRRGRGAGVRGAVKKPPPARLGDASPSGPSGRAEARCSSGRVEARCSRPGLKPPSCLESPTAASSPAAPPLAASSLRRASRARSLVLLTQSRVRMRPPKKGRLTTCPPCGSGHACTARSALPISARPFSKYAGAIRRTMRRKRRTWGRLDTTTTDFWKVPRRWLASLAWRKRV
mmetsp:Transcript_15554/g.47465  ORF Transcript_15554/g.47465 Transcript_15554/m.47465 type:complete len:219 (+) Transcript_15554:152-808(+)